jgi:acyl carrier protein
MKQIEEKILKIIINVIEEINEDQDVKVPIEQGSKAPLFGKDGVLDSLALVSLVVAVEQEIEDELGISISLADEKAISQVKSPFKTIGSLSMYAKSLINESELT